MDWDIGVAISQALVYVAVAGVLGGGFSLWLFAHYGPSSANSLLLTQQGTQQGMPQGTQQVTKLETRWIKRQMWVSAGLGIIFAIGGYLAFIGSINQSGLSGMLDSELMLFLLYDPPGKVAISQLVLFTVLAGALPFIVRKPAVLLCCVVALLLPITFTLRGHLASAPGWAQALLVLHVVSMSLWAGALLPLWLLARSNAVQQWQLVFVKFGHIAQVIVAALLLSGVSMLVYLLTSPADLFTTYGLAVSLKLAVVLVLLGCAVINKFWLVPKLQDVQRAAWLARVIYLEMLCVMFIFAITATFTLVIGKS
ncbi:MAG: CopD family protein [Idiomarina sp.]|nr:CopD family protein [Idiomarina sp.]